MNKRKNIFGLVISNKNSEKYGKNEKDTLKFVLQLSDKIARRKKNFFKAEFAIKKVNNSSVTIKRKVKRGD